MGAMPVHPNAELLEAGKRMADQVNLHITYSDPFLIRNSWMAFNLNNGESDGTVYDSLADAKRFTDEFQTAYLCFVGMLGGTNPVECAIYLDFCRKARDAGLGHRDPNAIPFLSTQGHDRMAARWQIPRWN
jgi:hypothetical protein